MDTPRLDERDDGPGEEIDAIERFLAMPPEHGVDNEPDADVEVAHPTIHRSLWQRVSHFLFEKEPGQYSSIAPRGPEGRRSKLFFFNGNGRGR